MKKIVEIDGMCCERCAARVCRILSTVKGVVSVDVKLKKNVAIIRSRESVSEEEITLNLTNAGFTALSFEDK